MHASPRHPRTLACMLVATGLALAACSRSMAVSGAPATPSSMQDGAAPHQAFGSAVPLRKGETARFADGLAITVESIDDSRCPANVACVWSGEIAARLSLRGGHAGAAREAKLGTVTQRKLAVAGYELALVEAGPDAIRLLVDRPPEKMIGPSH